MSEGNTWRRYRKVRDAWLEGKPCEKCGASEGVLLEACWRTQRLYPFATSRTWSMPTEKRQRYLADLVVLCRSCSSSRSHVPRFKNHGGGAVGIRGCKCDPCTEKRRKYNREQARKRRGST